MKKQIFVIFLFCFLNNVIFGQTRTPHLSIREKREAQALAFAFFSRYHETQDITPLIKEYFIKDYARRVKICGSTRECGGFAKDFWGPNQDLADLKGTEDDFQRFYSYGLNYLFLYVRSLNNLQLASNQKAGKSEDIANRTIEEKLGNVLKDTPELLKLGMFYESTSNEIIDTPKTLGEYRERLTDYEKLVAGLRVVELTTRNELKKSHPKQHDFISRKNFSIRLAEGKRPFFDYPIGTRMIEVWSDDTNVQFVMNLIREDSKLKIVAVYPPID